MAYKFENLEVWQRALEMSYLISQLVLKFPKDEIYVLSSQLKRAADSISLNIAEGSTGQSNAEFKRFLGYSVRSGLELVGGLHLAFKRNLIDQSQFDELMKEMEIIIRMTQALRNSIK
jgi:four helix bundle protein